VGVVAIDSKAHCGDPLGAETGEHRRPGPSTAPRHRLTASPGGVVLGDAAILRVCDALHLVRRLYDLTAPGGRGVWAVVVPGVVHQRQPLFNEKPGAMVFSIEGATLPVGR